MATSIDSKTKRAKLAVRREPYWSRIDQGCFIGFRRLSQGEGSWIARWRDDEGKQHYRALGEIPGDGKEYDQAVKLARAWFAQCAHGARPQVATVGEACRAYIEERRTTKGSTTANDADGRFKRLVYGNLDAEPPIPVNKIANVQLDKLRTSDVRTWLNAQVKADLSDDALRRAKDSANRNLAALKAALNRALKNRLVATDAGWKTVEAFHDVGERREHFLDIEERARLLAACDQGFRNFVEALLLTGARPGEIAKARLAGFDRKQGVVTLRGKTGSRVISLSTEAQKVFERVSQDRIGDAPLFINEVSKAWDRHDWKKRFRAAAKAAGLPDDLTLYGIRHTAISAMIRGGMDAFTVARLAGTSTAMIDKHYGHLNPEGTREKLDSIKIV